MQNILDMVDTSAPERQSKPGAVLYGTGGFLKKDPAKFSRNEKLAYIELKYKQLGQEADTEKFVMEIRLSRGISFESFRKARDYGLYYHKGSK